MGVGVGDGWGVVVIGTGYRYIPPPLQIRVHVSCWINWLNTCKLKYYSNFLKIEHLCSPVQRGEKSTCKFPRVRFSEICSNTS